MKRRFLSKIILAAFISAGIISANHMMTFAAPITDGEVELTQPNGETFNCYASGDEFYNYLHDKEGRAIIKDSKTGYYVYGKYANDSIVPSRKRVTSEKEIEEEKYDSRVKISEVKVPEEKIKKEQERFKSNEQTNSNKNKGELNNLVVFIKFSDQQELSTGLNIYERQFNSKDQASLNNYFNETSYQQLDIKTSFYPKSQGDKVLSYTDSKPRSYYTNVPEDQIAQREQTLLKDAINSIKNQIPKDLNIDSDNDGKIDNICFIVKGGTTGWSSLLWPHKWQMFMHDVNINGKALETYNFQLEDFINSNGIGVLSHEMFHTLGAPDLYHYNYDGKVAVGPWDVMDRTNKIPQSMGAYMKMRYGKWIDNIDEIGKSGHYSIQSISNPTNNSYIIKSPKSDTEYFVVEYRKKQGIYESGLPGEGLLVYRVDTKLDGQGNRTAKDELYLYRPNGSRTSEGDINLAPLGVSRTSLGGENRSDYLFFSDGSNSGISIDNVTIYGDKIDFDVNIGDGNKDGETTDEKTNQWEPGTSYKVGDIVNYEGKNYKCIQLHTSMVSWEPAVTPALWELVN